MNIGGYSGEDYEKSHEKRELSDANLLAAHRAGDSRAFPRLWARHSDRLLKVALRTTSSEDDAHDAVQEAFLKVHRKSEGLREDASVSTWLHRITLNSIYDNHRKLGKMVQEPVDHSTVHLLTAQEDYQNGQQFGIAGGQVIQLTVRDAMEKLPSYQREAINKMDIQGLTTEETADDLGVSEGTVKSRRARGRRELRKILTSTPLPKPVRPPAPPAKSLRECHAQ